MFSHGRGGVVSDRKAGESVGRLIEQAMPLPEGDSHYVTRGEFVRELNHLEGSFENRLEVTKHELQKWILGGILAFIGAFGLGGFSAYASVMNQFAIMRTASAEATRANDRLDKRLQWTIEQERRDAAQDIALQQTNPKYVPKTGGPSIPQ